PKKAPESKGRRYQKQRPRKELGGYPKSIPFDQECLRRRVFSQRARMPVVDNCARRVTALPAPPARSQTQVCVITVGKELLIEKPDIFEHLPAVKRGAAVGKEGFLLAIVLSSIHFPRAAAAIEPVRVEQMSDFIDKMAPVVEQDFRCDH